MALQCIRARPWVIGQTVPGSGLLSLASSHPLLLCFPYLSSNLEHAANGFYSSLNGSCAEFHRLPSKFLFHKKRIVVVLAMAGCHQVIWEKQFPNPSREA